jgi:predicted RNase H-like HicB family nuclease
MKLKVEFDREEDGRWIAEIRSLAGALAYGRTRAEALAAVQVLALRIVADRIEHGEAAGRPVTVAFATSR